MSEPRPHIATVEVVDVAGAAILVHCSIAYSAFAC
jgi:hypothetical protein